MSDFTVDTRSLSDSGSFPCPKCGPTLSPDDETDSVYEILGVSDDGVRVKCKGCGSNIRITTPDGFALKTMQKELALKGVEMKKETCSE